MADLTEVKDDAGNTFQMDKGEAERSGLLPVRDTSIVGPDDPDVFYDDGTPNTPAGNEPTEEVVGGRRLVTAEKARGAQNKARTVEPAADKK